MAVTEINLDDLKEGSIVVFRTGGSALVKEVTYNEEEYHWPYVILFSGITSPESYTQDGRNIPNVDSIVDIVEIK